MNSDGSASLKLSRRDGTCSWAVVDVDDLPLVAGYRWYEGRRKDTTYVEASLPKVPGARRAKVYMHRVIAQAPHDRHVDHEDGDGLNNRRSNLRVATQRDNRRNEVNAREHTSAYRGVSWNEDCQGWQVRCGIGTKHLYLGIYDTEIEAALVYDEAAREHFGEFARTNFTAEHAAALPKPRRRPRRDRNNLPHGRGRYTNYGCRCEVCRAAESAYQKRRRDKAAAQAKEAA